MNDLDKKIYKRLDARMRRLLAKEENDNYKYIIIGCDNDGDNVSVYKGVNADLMIKDLIDCKAIKDEFLVDCDVSNLSLKEKETLLANLKHELIVSTRRGDITHPIE